MAESGGDNPITAPPDSDAIRLSRAVARGDRAALAEFYNAWFDRCYSAARRFTGRDEAFCLDVVQDAMLKVVRSIQPKSSALDLERWMLSVVKSAALDALRRDSRRDTRERTRIGAAVRIPSNADAVATACEARDWVRDAVDGLPLDERVLVEARFGREQTLEQAGASAGLTGGAAHGRLRRTLMKLRTLAKELFDEH